MRALSAAVLTAFMGLLISGCTGQEMMEPMNSEMSSMDKPMEKSMEADAMMEGAATESMKPKMEGMDDTMKDETMMTDSAANPMKPNMEPMEKAAP